MIKNELPETDLTLSDFRYDLPEELIAQTPVFPRDSSRLMVVDRGGEGVEHRRFSDVVEYLRPGDTLVLNETRVIPARIVGRRAVRATAEGETEDTSGAPVELLLLKQTENDVWEALAGPGKRARPGDSLSFGDGVLTARVLSVGEGGTRTVKFTTDGAVGTVYEALHLLGTVPLPPYIKEKLDDPARYQTVYAKTEGSAAAPTAGLHFTEELLERIEDSGVAVARVTLHVGLGTFRPVKETKIRDHVMHSEYISVTEETARLINERRRAGGRTVAVGTTSCRTLESVADDSGEVRAFSGDTGIFIYPGYKFRATDALITNFHLPESTLLMLVSAFAGRERMLASYEEAVKERYRFFSFGDAMLIL
ncbi:MAG: tRNA preQ1(34) S-adenosylmethionine ribosyltransferase-isomerase QueA [Clostridia bacterium]|nr:tRNA preQ1(34) S-adenosylmethionine ribosyltransferase-isomerase QueA [Clostridia bacterium]